MHEAHRARLGPVLPFSVLPPLSRARGPCDLWSCCENGSSPLFPAPSVLARAVTVPETTANIGHQPPSFNRNFLPGTRSCKQ